MVYFNQQVPHVKGAAMQPYAAHVHRESGCIQSLTKHAENVASLCAQFAAPLHLVQTARLIALIHDMGKGTPTFQTYLIDDEKKRHIPMLQRAQSSLMNAGFLGMNPASALRRL